MRQNVRNTILSGILSLCLCVAGCTKPVAIPFEVQHMLGGGDSWMSKTVPVTRLDSVAQRDEFFDTYRHYFGKAESMLLQALSRFDEAFFQSRMVLVCIKFETSISITHEVKSVSLERGKVVVRIHRIEPEGQDLAIGYNYIFVLLDKKYGIFEFNVEFD
jgi:hypothetical protein